MSWTPGDGLEPIDERVQARAERILPCIAGDLSYLTLYADLTSVRHRCRFGVGPQGAIAARYLDLPFAAISFYGEGSGLRQALRGVLGPGEAAYALVGAVQCEQVRAVAEVLDVDLEWQLVYRGDPGTLDGGDARRLGQDDIPAMARLAARGGVYALGEGFLEQGPFYGVWRDGQLSSMSGTRLLVGGWAEIGNVVTDPGYRRQGLARMAVEATVEAHLCEGRQVLLHVFQTNEGARVLYERIGFQVVRTMYLVHLTAA